MKPYSVFARSATCVESLACIKKSLELAKKTHATVLYKIHLQFVQLICTICRATDFEKTPVFI